MLIRSLRQAIVFLVGGLLVGVSPPFASAHIVVAPTWSNEQQTEFKLDSTRAANLNGADADGSYFVGNNEWDGLAGSTLNFIQLGEFNLANKDGNLNPCGGPHPDGTTEVFIYGNGPAFPGLAATWRCIGIIHLEHAYMFVDPTHPWFVADVGIGIGQYDLRGAVTHEFGHAGGMNIDFAVGPLCPQENDNDPPDHTMCGQMMIGRTRYRTLEEHDIHSMEGFY